MKAMALTFGLLCLSHSAVASSLNVGDFTGRYLMPEGEATAQSLALPNHDPLHGVRLSFEKVDENTLQFRTSDDELEYQWNEIPSFFQETIAAHWTGINLSKTTNSIALSGSHLHTVGTKQDLNFRTLSLSCQLPNHTEDDAAEALLQGCLNRQSQFRLRLFELTKKGSSSFLSELTSTVNSLFAGDENWTQNTDRFENIELNIRGDDFDGQVTTRVVINATVRLNGKVYYEQEHSRIRLRIDRARAGLLNVTGMLFDELDKLNSEKVIVSRPWVTVHLD
jgi:hypothetical protein